MLLRTLFRLCIFGWLFLAVMPDRVTAAQSVAGPPAQSVAGPPAHSVASPPAQSVAGPPAHANAAISREILFFVNEFRRSKGLPALQANSYISSVALGHSRDMLTGKSPFGHDGFRRRIDQISTRVGKLQVAAENVASGPMDAREVVDGWLHSPGHRRNIMGDFQLTGIGVAEAANGMIYFTQIFVK